MRIIERLVEVIVWYNTGKEIIRERKGAYRSVDPHVFNSD